MPKIGSIFIKGTIGKFEDEDDYVELVDVVSQVNMQKDAEAYNVYIDMMYWYQIQI